MTKISSEVSCCTIAAPKTWGRRRQHEPPRATRAPRADPRGEVGPAHRHAGRRGGGSVDVVRHACAAPSPAHEQPAARGWPARPGTPGARRGSSTAGRSARPMVWATPSTMPPPSVPHSEPSPPITTASNAKMSWVGPLAASKRRVDGRGTRRPGWRCRPRSRSPARRRATPHPDQLGGVGVLGGGPHLAAERGAAQDQLQPAEHRDRHAPARARRGTGSTARRRAASCRC